MTATTTPTGTGPAHGTDTDADTDTDAGADTDTDAGSGSGAGARLPAGARPARLWPAVRFELVKLLSQGRVRAVLAGCWLGPGLLVAVLSRQSSLPTDTVFGRWMGATGWAGSLVALSFCCSWLLPLLTALVAGDVFAAEDRLGTWRHLLVAVRSPRRVFAAKALAGLTVVLLLVAGLAASSTAGGLVAAGDRTLVGLDGAPLGPGHAGAAVLLSWAAVLAPTLALAAVGLLGSVAFGRSPAGLLLPAVLALSLQAAQLLPLPVVLRVSLPGYGPAWRGLVSGQAQAGPLVVGVVVSLAWAAAACALAVRLFLRRDFSDLAHDGAGRVLLVGAALPLAALLAATTAVVAVTTPAAGSGIDGVYLERSLATVFGHLYRLQSRELHRPDVSERQLASGATCDRGGPQVADRGPGHDGRCVVTWHLPGTTATGSAVYQLDVHPDGRYVADGDGPAAVNGSFIVRTVTGDAPNPLWQLDGSVDLLAPPSKG